MRKVAKSMALLNSAIFSGGAERAAQIAVLSLLEKNALSWMTGSTFSSGRVLPNQPLPSDCHWLEKSLYSSVAAKGDSGTTIVELKKELRKIITPLSGKMARLGLRPTSDERSAKGFYAILPLLALVIIGAIKLSRGLMNDKPVGFLIALLILSVFAASILHAKTAKLTPAGQKIVNELRAKNPLGSQTNLTTVALFGAPAATLYAQSIGLEDAFLRELNKTPQKGSDHSSEDSDSGCGTSGCSSSGCGGCGGCGD